MADPSLDFLGIKREIDQTEIINNNDLEVYDSQLNRLHADTFCRKYGIDDEFLGGIKKSLGL